MKRIKLYTSQTLDGFIARPDGRLDWLESLENPTNIDHGYDQFLSGIDTIIMGRKTYDIILSYNIEWPYKLFTTYIISRNNFYQINTENTYLVSGNIIEQIITIKSGNGKDIWLVGGGKINTMFLNNYLIDDMILSVVPVIIGEGLPLFPDGPVENNFKFLDSTAYETGIVNLTYRRLKS